MKKPLPARQPAVRTRAGCPSPLRPGNKALGLGTRTPLLSSVGQISFSRSRRTETRRPRLSTVKPGRGPRCGLWTVGCPRRWPGARGSRGGAQRGRWHACPFGLFIVSGPTGQACLAADVKGPTRGQRRFSLSVFDPITPWCRASQRQLRRKSGTPPSSQAPAGLSRNVPERRC